MLAVATQILEKNTEDQVLYWMGEEFTTEIVNAIRNKTTYAFKDKYRKLKLLMIDDIQFLAGKNAVQEEFFHTFNTLQREGGQIILTSDRPPSEIEKLEERLRSRFEAGLIIDISPPDFELRTAIALIKAKEKGTDLPMNVAQAIAANIDSPRKIEGFLTRLFTQSSFNNEEISVETVNKILGKTQTENALYRKAVSPQEFIGAVSDYYSLGKRKLLGANRTQIVAMPRQILMYLLRIELGLPLQEVGRIVGGRDHTTVMHAVEKISKNLSTNSGLRDDILGIKKSVSA
jgi:chromosomal replication initiator protein